MGRPDDEYNELFDKEKKEDIYIYIYIYICIV